MNEDIGKIAVIAGILGVLLLFGLLTQTSENAGVAPAEAVSQAAPAATIAPQVSLQMLDPSYSEKAIFHDDTIRVAFKGSFTEDGVQSRLPFWIHNISDDVINILWDRCSIQLPSGNTVNVAHESPSDLIPPIGGTISIAPAGDLYDAIIPITEIDWSDAGTQISTGVFDQGTFVLVLAVERAATTPVAAVRRQVAAPADSTSCAPSDEPMANCRVVAAPQQGREIAYYTFRFVIR